MLNKHKPSLKAYHSDLSGRNLSTSTLLLILLMISTSKFKGSIYTSDSNTLKLTLLNKTRRLISKGCLLTDSMIFYLTTRLRGSKKKILKEALDRTLWYNHKAKSLMTKSISIWTGLPTSSSRLRVRDLPLQTLCFALTCFSMALTSGVWLFGCHWLMK